MASDDGAVKTTVVALVALGMIVVAAVLIIKDVKRESVKRALPVFVCLGCRHHFDLDQKAVKGLVQDNPHPDGSIRCPSCGEFSCWRAVQCPHCGEYFALLFAEVDPETGARICWHCEKPFSAKSESE